MKHRPQTVPLTSAQAIPTDSQTGCDAPVKLLTEDVSFESPYRNSWCCFPTDLGWLAFAGTEEGIARVLIGHESRQALLDAIVSRESNPVFGEFAPEWCSLLERYASGQRVDLTRVPLVRRRLTSFQQRVVEATRRIPFGSTSTYQTLAATAGSPDAARAVGHVMATNPVPLLVPCHRVLAAGGKLGGFSAPTGLDLKRRLLALESDAT